MQQSSSECNGKLELSWASSRQTDQKKSDRGQMTTDTTPTSVSAYTQREQAQDANSDNVQITMTTATSADDTISVPVTVAEAYDVRNSVSENHGSLVALQLPSRHPSRNHLKRQLTRLATTFQLTSGETFRPDAERIRSLTVTPDDTDRWAKFLRDLPFVIFIIALFMFDLTLGERMWSLSVFVILHAYFIPFHIVLWRAKHLYYLNVKYARLADCESHDLSRWR